MPKLKKRLGKRFVKSEPRPDPKLDLESGFEDVGLDLQGNLRVESMGPLTEYIRGPSLTDPNEVYFALGAPDDRSLYGPDELAMITENPGGVPIGYPVNHPSRLFETGAEPPPVCSCASPYDRRVHYADEHVGHEPGPRETVEIVSLGLSTYAHEWSEQQVRVLLEREVRGVPVNDYVGEPSAEELVRRAKRAK